MTLYMFPFIIVLIPTYSVWDTGVVHRITHVFSYFFFCLYTNHLLFDTKKRGYCIKSKANHSYSHNKITGTHHALVRDCFSPSTASIRYRLPAVISFKFTSLTITNGPRTHVASLTYKAWSYTVCNKRQQT